uniref:Uncharacterized protein n=1 Tax=viral metagenome TaxID=1070528 RepID=A0A6C0ADU8_9ZZZZ
MKCERKHHVSKYKPYCGDCYKIIKEDDIYTFSEKIFITEEEKRILRNKLNFLYDVKKYKDYGLTCSICINKYETHEKREDYYSPGSNYVSCKLWFMYYGNLSICDICLENEMVKRNII